ncbi:MAG: hypothetical protein ACRD22_16545, partial [Terriglobia bacterium]
MESENPTGADNQQERPVSAQWIVGFVDGEGVTIIGKTCGAIASGDRPICHPASSRSSKSIRWERLS